MNNYIIKHQKCCRESLQLYCNLFFSILYKLLVKLFFKIKIQKNPNTEQKPYYYILKIKLYKINILKYKKVLSDLSRFRDFSPPDQQRAGSLTRLYV